MVHAKLSENQIDGLRLIQRSPDVDGWKGPVKLDGIWDMFKDYPVELVEKRTTIDGRFLRLTPIGRGIIDWT